jgi:uncharacterized membrane protein
MSKIKSSLRSIAIGALIVLLGIGLQIAFLVGVAKYPEVVATIFWVAILFALGMSLFPHAFSRKGEQSLPSRGLTREELLRADEAENILKERKRKLEEGVYTFLASQKSGQ